jgi:hypothetical protein
MKTRSLKERRREEFAEAPGALELKGIKTRSSPHSGRSTNSRGLPGLASSGLMPKPLMEHTPPSSPHRFSIADMESPSARHVFRTSEDSNPSREGPAPFQITMEKDLTGWNGE